MLTSCASTSAPRVELPAMPSDLAGCFDNLTPEPKAGALTKRQTFTLIASLRRSEVAKSLCGKRALSFYDDLQEGLSRGR